MSIIGVLTIFLSLALASNESHAADYFPLLKGNSWEYHHSNGGTGKVEVIGSENVSGKRTTHVHDQTGDLYYIKTQYRVILYASPEEVYGEDNLVLKLPPKKGERFDIGKDGAYAIIIDTAATVKVPAGIFKDCIVKKMYVPEASKMAQKMTSGKVDAVYIVEYFAPDVGLIKKEQALYKGSVEVERKMLKELVNYKVPGSNLNGPTIMYP